MAVMPKILIADDDVALAETYKTRLEEEFFDVILAFDGEEALKKAREESPHVILLDVVMPKKSGAEVLLELKKEPLTADIPVIILTNLGGEIADMKVAQELGAVNFLIKSLVEPRDVVVAVRRALKGRAI